MEANLMTKIIFLLVLFAAQLTAFSDTFESNQITDLLQYADEATWVFCDIDETLIESVTQLGSAQWRSHIYRKALQAGYEVPEARMILAQFWRFVQPFISVQVVDPNAAEVLRNLCQSTAAVMALTARDPIEASYTSKQLDSAHITLSQDKIVGSFFLSPQSLYERGIIFSGGQPKGQTLIAFFEKIGHMPKKIVFIDDRWEHVIEVDACMKQHGIECIAIRFSGADERVKTFEVAVAEQQWAYLPKMLSDAQAKTINLQSSLQ
jgi:hypothetical protein